MKEYDPKAIEPKWQSEWEKAGLYQAEKDKLFGSPSTWLRASKPKWYSLMEFPYPSGDGLHTGHVRGFTAMDIVSRKRRMQGYNVLYPIGWDAFGLPTENFALKTGRQPADITEENSSNFRKQFKKLGMSFDWSREINTTDPAYYKWTQWLFLKFLEKGLAYKAKIPINWCPKDKIGLANEEVVDGKCERCGTPVEEKEKEQWMLKITAYADKLYDDLDTVDFPSRVKAQQRNWIGRSEGAEISFKVGKSESLKVFTTRPETIFGATYIAVAGKEDKFTGKYAINPATQEEIPVWEAEYVYSDYGTGAIMAVPAHDQRDFEFAKKHDLPIRQVIAEHLLDKNAPLRSDKKTVRRKVVQGVIRHWQDDKILALKWKKQPWTTFVIGGVEEGETFEEAIKREVREETGFTNFRVVRRLGWKMVSEFFAAHKDENRYADMEVFYLELDGPERAELSDEEKEKHEIHWVDTGRLTLDIDPCSEKFVVENYLKNGDHAYEGAGILVNSGEFDGRSSDEAKDEVTKFVGGEKKTTYKLRDWVFSRQRYWGEPIPVVHCEKCGIVPVPESELPVELPKVENYQPTETGESPLANIEEWVNTRCPKCQGDAKRETDVMPNWAGSSWYFLRYVDPHNSKAFASAKALKQWMSVDWYNGGMEHTTLHLLYSRFWNKFLFDLGLVPTSEPYHKRTSHGVILAADGRKMSKSLGNVINPDDMVERFGADTLRLYEMFMGPFEQAIAWSEESLVGPRRFLEKVWRLRYKNFSEVSSEHTAKNHTIKKVTEDIEDMKFNTAISALMVYTSALEDAREVSKEDYETLLLLLAPFAPYMSEEIWHELGHGSSIHQEPWPKYDPKKVQSGEVTLAVQIDGKVRATLLVSREEDEDTVRERVLSMPEVEKWLAGKSPAKVLVIPGKVVSIVTKT